MTQTSHLNGRVLKQTLPCLTPGGGGAMPAMKRLKLAQGDLAQFHDADTPIHYIASLDLVAGTVRGNHVHRAKLEHLYLLRGELELILEDLETGERDTVRLVAGDRAVIQPGVAHAYRVLQGGVAVEFAPQRFDPDDTRPHKVV